MKTPIPLVAKNGRSEWPYKGKTVIAIPKDIKHGCRGCIKIRDTRCYETPNMPTCLISDEGFSELVIFIEKPSN